MAEHKSWKKKSQKEQFKNKDKSGEGSIYQSSQAEAVAAEEHIYSLQVSRIDKGSVSSSL